MALLAFKENYGQWGHLPRKEWKRKLHSNLGLFLKLPPAPPQCIGPMLDSHGKVSGDSAMLETAYFVKRASPEQIRFYEELIEVNVPAGYEYLLTLCQSLSRWKNDFRWLLVALQYLKNEEHCLEEETALIQQAARKSPEALTRHFPQLFHDLDVAGLGFEDMLSRIKTILEEKIRPEEKYLKTYLALKKREMPFLFEAE